ncbi:ABC transporter ATP-binding protein [Bradyrhizobium sp.]|uniref:ABC transporter ATP-binding protein n=1 Tax=Bradyrhizobium sp. TaxID=376 RepID=UPI0039E729F7
MSRICVRDVDLHYYSVAFRERSLKRALASLVTSGGKARRIDDIHALKQITVEVSPGERVALIGSNGAGKSTFLKMLAGLYPISAGHRHIEGRIRSLFDLSLGFEPDASGRENILYRGLLMGMTPRAMQKMEDGIVEFADLGEFIDYPVKTYSAGMQVRLAFAIATSVGGDILLIDEVIGAGDAAFMRRAQTRIRSLIDNSEMLVLASHDFSSLRTLCSRGLVLDRGRLVFDGEINDAISSYLSLNNLTDVSPSQARSN